METSRQIEQKPGAIAIPPVRVLMDVSQGQRPTIYVRIMKTTPITGEPRQVLQGIIDKYMDMPAVADWDGYAATEFVKADIDRYLKNQVRQKRLVRNALDTGWIWQ